MAEEKSSTLKFPVYYCLAIFSPVGKVCLLKILFSVFIKYLLRISYLDRAFLYNYIRHTVGLKQLATHQDQN